MKTVILILVFFSILGCQLKSDKINYNAVSNSDINFQFTIKESTDFIDSRTGSLTRQYKEKPITVHFKFTQEEMEKIQSIYFQNKLDSLPDFYYPNCKPTSEPTFEDEYVIYFKGKQKKIIYNADQTCLDSESEKLVKKFEAFRTVIFEILNKKTEVEQLEISDIVFF